MAQKRMFDKSITNSDDFLAMPSSTQNLYFHLSMNADDDGFINNWKSIIKLTSSTEDDLKLLIMKSYIIPFESGVIVIKHWRINNFLRKDRYKATNFKKEYKQLFLKENQEYVLRSTNGQPSIDKNSIDNSSTNIDNYILTTTTTTSITREQFLNDIEHLFNRILNGEEQRFFTEVEINDVTLYAIKEAGKQNKLNVKYIEKIIKDCKQKGITTKEQIEKRELEFEKSKSNNSKNNRQVVNYEQI